MHMYIETTSRDLMVHFAFGFRFPTGGSFLCRNSHPEWTESRKMLNFFPSVQSLDFSFKTSGFEILFMSSQESCLFQKITVTIREGGQWDGTRIHSVSASLLYYCVCHGWVILSGRQESRLSLQWEQTTRCVEVGYRDNPTGSDL